MFDCVTIIFSQYLAGNEKSEVNQEICSKCNVSSNAIKFHKTPFDKSFDICSTRNYI